MAARTLFPPHIALNHSDGTWSLANDDARNQTKPVAGDSETYSADSGGLTLDEDTGALVDVNMTGYTGTLKSHNVAADPHLTVSGTLTLDGTIADDPAPSHITFDPNGHLVLTAGMSLTLVSNYIFGGTGNITPNGIAMGHIEINTAGTHTTVGALDTTGLTVTTGTFVLGDDVAVGSANFLFTNGTFNMASNDITITGGDLTWAGGTLSNSGTFFHGGTGDADWKTSGSKMGNYVLLSGAVITRTDEVRTLKATIPADATLAASGATSYLYLYNPTANDFLEILGTATTGDVLIYLNANRSNSKQILCPTVELKVFGSNDILTQSARVTCSTLQVRGLANNYGGITFSGAGGSLGDIELGLAGTATMDGRVDFGTGSFDIDSLADVGGANGHVVAVGSAYIQINGGGTWNATGVATATATVGACHIEGLGTATVSNFNPDAMVHCHNCTDGGGNGANVDFDAHTPPGTMTMMGIGI